MDVLEIKLETLEVTAETAEWIESMGPLKTLGDLFKKLPDPFTDEDNEEACEAAEDVCQALGYLIWSKYGLNK
jgi:hypothetical protein